VDEIPNVETWRNTTTREIVAVVHPRRGEAFAIELSAGLARSIRDRRRLRQLIGTMATNPVLVEWATAALADEAREVQLLEQLDGLYDAPAPGGTDS